MSYKGKFTPQHPEKYKGDATNIIYRSSWEVRVMKYLDNNPAIIWWGSEELHIPYYNPVDKKMHRYFPDFIAKVKRKDTTQYYMYNTSTVQTVQVATSFSASARPGAAVFLIYTELDVSSCI